MPLTTRKQRLALSLPRACAAVPSPAPFPPPAPMKPPPLFPPPGAKQVRAFDHNSTAAVSAVALISGEPLAGHPSATATAVGAEAGPDGRTATAGLANTGGGAAPPGERWYPTLRAGLMLLSQAYACLPRTVFEGISQARGPTRRAVLLLLHLPLPPTPTSASARDTAPALAKPFCDYPRTRSPAAGAPFPPYPCTPPEGRRCLTSLPILAPRRPVAGGA